MRTTAIIGGVWILAWAAAGYAAAESGYVVRVGAGEVERRESLVTFMMPPGTEGKQWQVRDEQGAAAAVQVRGGKGSFVVKELAAGKTAAYRLEAATETSKDGVEVVREGGVVKVSAGGKPVLAYQGQKSVLPAGYDPAFARGGYIHPVMTPGGVAVTDDYPPNHKHHHGIWNPWTKTEFEGRHPDFWNMGDKTGTVEFVELGETYGGPAMGGFSAKHRMVDLSAQPEAKAALEETWEVTVYRGGAGYFVFDLAITQKCAGGSPLLLPKYYYGGLGFRGHRQWDGKGKAEYLTSEGKDRSNGNETRGKWCLVNGKVDGKAAGVVIMDHPANFRYPQPMRLHPTEPFFCYAPSQLGDWAIEPGKPYVARYRFVVADGVMEKGEIERMWRDFAEPARVEVGG